MLGRDLAPLRHQISELPEIKMDVIEYRSSSVGMRVLTRIHLRGAFEGVPPG